MGRIPRDWPQIVGADLARFCVPESLDFPRGRRDGATLRVVALPGRALEIQHLAPQIIERVNGHFGWAAVARMTIRQGLLPKPPKSTRLAALGEALTARTPAGATGGTGGPAKE